MPTPIYVETHIRASLDRVWELTQDTQQHPRWDGRFSRITPVEALATGGYRFRYELRVPFHTLAGTGTSLGERHRPDGTRTSALRFTTPDRLSPLGDGRGYWRYVPTADGVTFVTGYDYEPGWGRALDRLVVRPLVGWLTAWSFDRLRLWAEDGVEPERWPLWSVLAVWRPDRPRAGRCLRAPRRGPTDRVAPSRTAPTGAPTPPGPSVMDDAPTTLDQLEAP
ncbi:SRPBCC family protein [Cellulomonas wangleii]|uniref:SRPBCC family protein n=1 Tax=Cellulomonas wangleii TaxID=2816956 RepID=UPI0020BD6739|nr:SRPBCC family protein [Cellulomonas wangleii]